MEKSQEVTLGDGRALKAIGYGDVVLRMSLLDDKLKSCTLHNVLYVPDLSYIC